MPPGRAAWLFAVYGFTAVVLLSILMPPFQNPDELNHFMRSDQVAGGGLIGTRYPVLLADGSWIILAGGLVDPAILLAEAQFDGVRFDRDARATRSMWDKRVMWSGTRQLNAFPNTVLYPPVFYFPAAMAIHAGKTLRLTVTQTLVVARLFTGATAVLISAIAVSLAAGLAVWMFAVLTLPMSWSLMASASQDGLLLACVALAVAAIMNVTRRGERMTLARGAMVVMLLALAGAGRPPYAAMGLLPMALGKNSWRWRLAAVTAVLALCVSWWGLTALTVLTNYGQPQTGADQHAQVVFLTQYPTVLFNVVAETFARFWPNFASEFIGVLGWLDVDLPRTYHDVAWVILGIAAMVIMLDKSDSKAGRVQPLFVLVLCVVAVWAILLSLYLAWTRPENGFVQGVQGRYFLPVAVALGAAIPAFGAASWMPVRNALAMTVAAFPIVSLATVIRTIVLRYYLT